MKSSMFLYKNQPGLGLGPNEENTTTTKENGNGGGFWDKVNKALDTVDRAVDTTSTVITGSNGSSNGQNGGGQQSAQPNHTANIVKAGLWLGGGALSIYALSKVLSNSN